MASENAKRKTRIVHGDKDLSSLVRALIKANDPDRVVEFLGGLLTPGERANIALRWELVKMLERGISQRDIARMLGISLCKITRGSRELKRGPEGFRTVVWAGLELDGQERGRRKLPGRPTKRKADSLTN